MSAEPSEAHERGTGTVSPPRPATPRWVKVAGGVLAALVVLVLVLLLSGGEHGPGRHTGGGDAPAATQPGPHTGPPAGGHGP